MALDIPNTKIADKIDDFDQMKQSSDVKNILLITQNNLDLDLIKKTLERMGELKIYEAGNLKTAFNIAKTIQIDLIIVDDKLPTAKGFEIIDRFNNKSAMKKVPKILLISKSFEKDRYEHYYDTNLDFMQKPIDVMILKARVHTLFKNMHTKHENSVFEDMINSKIDQAKSFLTIYKSFMNIDENILFIYDFNKNRVLEANDNFKRFFHDEEIFNKIIAKDKFIKKFVPYMEDSNYLNRYKPKQWIDIIKAAQGFTLGIKIKKKDTFYSFSVLFRKIELINEDMYIIKLLNNQQFLTTDTSKNMDKCKNNVNKMLLKLKNELYKEEDDREYTKIFTFLKDISKEINEDDQESVLDVNIYKHHEINAYFVIASLLKKYAQNKSLYLNGNKVTNSLEENQEQFYLKIDADALKDSVKGIIDSYFTAPVAYDKRKIYISLYTINNHLDIEIKTSDRKEKPKDLSMFDKILKKNDLTFSNDHKDDIMPKRVQSALDQLKANVRQVSGNGHTIFIISIPLNKKVK